MATSVADDVATYFDNLSLGSFVAGGNIITGEMPPTPDFVICIRDTPGYPNVDAFDGPVFTNPGVQVAVRASTYQQAWDAALNCWRACVIATPVVLNGTKYHYLKPAQMPFQMPSDGDGVSGRRIFVFNVDCCSDPR